MRSLRKKLDSVQLNLYKQFPVKFREQAAVEIVEDGRGGVVIQQEHRPKVEPERRSLRNASRNLNYAEPEDDVAKPPPQQQQPKSDEATGETVSLPPPPADLPPAGPKKLIRDPLIIGESYYASRFASRGSWMKVKLLDIIREERPSFNQQISKTMYKVRVEDKEFNHYLVQGKELAYTTPPKVRLEAGARVLAKFDFANSVVLTKGPTSASKKDSYYPGIVGESLCPQNAYRYLVFFDDGYAQYVDFKHVFLTIESSEHVWEDINEQNRDFIKKYVQVYPNRSMVKLQTGQTVQVEYNGR